MRQEFSGPKIRLTSEFFDIPGVYVTQIRKNDAGRDKNQDRQGYE